MKLVFILGNQLFSPELLKTKIGGSKKVTIFMREDAELCTHFCYHKHKIIFFLAAMREYVEELKQAGFQVHFEKLEKESGPYEKSLLNFIHLNAVNSLAWFEIEDKFFEKRIETMIQGLKIQTEVWPSPMFVTSRKQFRDYLETTKKPFMKTFYESQRKRLNILVDAQKKPIGGQWSFDEDNRKRLPNDQKLPDLAKIELNSIQIEVSELVGKEFKDHPGHEKNFWLPTDRKRAQAWLQDFLKNRFREFGPFEDALSKRSPFLFHSILTPFLNVGLLTPGEVVEEVLKVVEKEKIPLNSCEGFIRQVIGWREFIHGIYQNYSDTQESTNFWNHQRSLTHHWYDGTTGIEPLDEVIKKVVRYGYAHHIERLMVVGSMMLLLQIHPQEAHRWFMEMFIDSSDWVMGPNVYGMAIFSDGGIFATKPYICGSNFYKKMGSYKSGEWCDGVDGLYWSFIEQHKKYFQQNYRLSMMVKLLEKMPSEKKERLFKSAEGLRKKLTK